MKTSLVIAVDRNLLLENLPYMLHHWKNNLKVEEVEHAEKVGVEWFRIVYDRDLYYKVSCRQARIFCRSLQLILSHH